MSWPSLVRAYIAGITAEFGTRASIATPPNLHELEGFIRVTKGPGSDDKIYDSSLVDFDVFAQTYDKAEKDAEALRAWVLTTQNRKLGGVIIGQVQTATSPVWVDWGNPNVHRFVYSARVVTKRT